MLSPLLANYLLPEKRVLIYAVKGVIAMTMALFIAMYLNLDRPYWALVSAVFLQTRPESGLVIEKGFCQIIGSLIGGSVGILVINLLSPYPLLAIAFLALWLGFCSAMASMLHHINFIYAFAMAGMTAVLVVMLTMADAGHASSQTVFTIAQARISEIIVGSLCATLVSQLFWPVRVKDGLRKHARDVINNTLDYLALELDLASSHEQRHRHVDKILEIMMALNDDANAVSYEGPEGPGMGRATSLLCNKLMSLLAEIQIIGRFQRNHADLVTVSFSELISVMRQHFQEMAQTDSYNVAYQQAQSMRRTLLHFHAGQVADSPIESRLIQTSMELAADLAMVLKAYDALEHCGQTRLKAPSMATHKDPLIGAVNGFRTAVVFLLGASVWLAFGGYAPLMMMILPVVFSIMFARFPLGLLTVIFKRLLIGVAIAVPVSLFLALGLLAKSSGDFELLILVLAGPYFLGLMALANRPLLPYGLGFCIPFTIIVRPSNGMSFDAAIAISSAMGIFVGVFVLLWVFQLIAPPDSQLMQRRILHATAKDLTDLFNHQYPDDWFNGRMGERLLRLANYDQGSGNQQRYMTDLGFTGLNLGHVSIRLRRLIRGYRSRALDSELDQWQHILAETYLLAAGGKFNEPFRDVSRQLLYTACQTGVPAAQTALLEGMFRRLAMTFERIADTVAQTHEDNRKLARLHNGS